MSRGQPVSVRLEPALQEKLGALATALDRPRSWVIEQAVAAYVEQQAWQLAAIDAGIAAADAGRVVPHDAVAAWVRSWDSPEELPPPASDPRPII